MMDVEFETAFKFEFVGKLFAAAEPRPDSKIWTVVHDTSAGVRDFFEYIQSDVRWVLHDESRSFVPY